MITIGSSNRTLYGGVLLCLGFVVGTSYYDPGVNLSFLFYSVLLLTGAALIANSPCDLQQRSPWVEITCYFALVALLLHQLFLTVSPDSSFSVSVGLAMIPFVVLLMQRLNGNQVFQALFWVMFLFASISCIRFVGWGHRAYDPLLDPNNYVTLLYLALIPWMHQRLTRRAAMFNRTMLVETAIATVFSLALLATHSRYAWLVLVAVTVYWAVLWKAHRLINGHMLAACAGGFLIGVGIYALIGQAEISSNMAATVLETNTTSSRQTLISTSFKMIVEEGGWIGKGAYTFSLYYPLFRDLSDQVTSGLYVHNDYLQLFFEGGLLFLVPLLALGGATGSRLLRGLLGKPQDLEQLGYLLALGLALLHANLNFIFYILPIAIFLGVVIAQAFRANRVSDASALGLKSSLLQNSIPLQKGAWQISVVTVLVALIYLCVDAYSYSVFAGQPGMPGTAAIRGDAAKSEQFADLNIRFNADRGIPVLARAQLAERTLGDESAPNKQAHVSALYKQAINVDPYNPLAYASKFKFIQRTGFAEGRSSDELIEQTLVLAPQNAAYATMAMKYYAPRDLPKAVEVALRVAPWCEYLAKRDRPSMGELGKTMSAVNDRASSPELARLLQECRSFYANAKADKRMATVVQNWLLSGN
ncbi:MAG: hypothetical protein ACI9ON_000282 [Limisphaerales bacterium]